ncbi:MAG TPA: hypothetical protein VLG37_03975 [Candidatus Saccharimonadales bacterium]|nr:hypothetical protein [Candidatus Saccharimonadales bacterium]
MKPKIEYLTWPINLSLQVAKWAGGRVLGRFGMGDNRLSELMEEDREPAMLVETVQDTVKRSHKPDFLLYSARAQNRSLAKIAVRGLLDRVAAGDDMIEDHILTIKTIMVDHLPAGTTFELLGYEGPDLEILRQHFPGLCKEEVPNV